MDREKHGSVSFWPERNGLHADLNRAEERAELHFYIRKLMHKFHRRDSQDDPYPRTRMRVLR